MATVEILVPSMSICQLCKKEFPYSRGKKYCSEKCRKRAYARRQVESRKVEKTCEVCGKVFRTSYPWQTYCSRKCQRSVHLKEKKPRACLACGTIFVPTCNHHYYCSVACRIASKRKHKQHKVKREKSIFDLIDEYVRNAVGGE